MTRAVPERCPGVRKHLRVCVRCFVRRSILNVFGCFVQICTCSAFDGVLVLAFVWFDTCWALKVLEFEHMLG